MPSRTKTFYQVHWTFGLVANRYGKSDSEGPHKYRKVSLERHEAPYGDLKVFSTFAWEGEETIGFDGSSSVGVDGRMWHDQTPMSKAALLEFNYRCLEAPWVESPRQDGNTRVFADETGMEHYA